MLFEKYSTKSIILRERVSTHTPSSSGFKEPMPFSQNLINGLKMHNQQLATKTGKNQLDMYLDESTLDYGDHENLDVLKWWKDNRGRFTDLSVMVCDLLSIPITTVASESAFSIGSIVLNKYRSRLLSKNAEALICTHNWLHGFVSDDEDDDDKDDAKVGMTLSKQASNVLNLEDDED